MKTSIRFILWLSGVAAGSVSAAPLSEGEVTRVINDVKVLPVEASPFAAKPGERISGRTAVSTGAQSRAELKFADNTLTRMGANSVFRMDQKTRTVDLQQGVILLQVPKQLGGATVRTAAVTAAVTGTTVLFEYTSDGFIKIIVIEGEVDVSLNKDKSKFRTLKAGDMWITKADDRDNLPLPVQVDLVRLQRTSKLLNTDEFAPLGNQKYVAAALKDQRNKKNKGELLDTSFQIEGRGRNVTLLLADHEHISGPPAPTSPPQPPPPPPPPSRKAVNNPGSTVFDNQSTIRTASPSNGYNSVAGGFAPLPGKDYTPGQDDPIGQFMFDDPQAFTGLDPVLAGKSSWATLKGDAIYIAGNPAVDSSNGPRNLIMGATGDINFTANPPVQTTVLATGLMTSNQWVLDDNIESIVFASLSGSINVTNFSLFGSSNDYIGFHADGPSSDVNITGTVEDQIALPEGNFQAAAGRDINISGPSVFAKNVDLSAERNVAVAAGSTITGSESIRVKAKQSVKISNSSQLRSLSQLGTGTIRIDAQNGKVEVLAGSTVEADNTVNLASHQSDVSIMNSSLSARVIKARVFDTGGVLMVSDAILGRGAGASDLIRLYGEGAQGVRFVGNTTLQGNRVDIAGPIVTIDPGSQVQLSNPAGTNVYSNSHQYNNGSNGNFVGLGGGSAGGNPVQVNSQPFKNRPKY